MNELYANAKIRFETVDQFSTESIVKKDCSVSVRIVKNLDHIPNLSFPMNGAYLVHLSVGSATQSRPCITEEEARELAVRFLVREAYGVGPTFH